MTTDWGALDRARRRLPVGQTVRGTVAFIPRPGTIGIFIDLDDEATQGFVDVGTLPPEPASWPPVGTKIDFEVLQHRPGQVRLWPLETQWRRDGQFIDDATWAETRLRYSPGQVTSARITQVFLGDRTYSVTFEGQHGLLEWSDDPPIVGSVGTYRITKMLDTTRRMLLASVDGSD